MSTGFAKHWKAWLNAISLVALVVLAVLLRHQLVETLENLRHVHASALLLIIPIEYLNYHAQAKLYQSLFGILGTKIGYRYLFETSLELNFINNVFPTGGVSGVSYFGVRMRSEQTTGGRATVVQLMKLVMIFFSFEILLFFGLFILAIAGRASNITILIAGMLTAVVFILTGLAMFIVGSNARINATMTFLTRLLNKLIRIFRPGHPEAINIERARMLFTELHQNYLEFRSKYRQLKMPLVWALVANLTEVLAVYVVYLAFGHWVNIGAIILAYAVANVSGFISVFPGGIGIYEALMTAVLATAGIRPSLSIPVIIMYRVVNTIIQLPPGYYFYHRTMRNGGLTTIQEHNAGP